MLKRCIIPLAVLLGLPGAAMAQADMKLDVTSSPGQATAQGVAKVTATITAIDAPRRHVTLKTQAGKDIEMTVGDEARNFDQLRVGDQVTVAYQEALTVSLKKGSGASTVQEREIAERSQPGAKPGGKMGREVTIVAQVVAVDKDAQVITVKGPGGRVVDLLVGDPQHMKGVKKGDRVQAVYTEAVAVSVEPAAAR